MLLEWMVYKCDMWQLVVWFYRIKTERVENKRYARVFPRESTEGTSCLKSSRWRKEKDAGWEEGCDETAAGKPGSRNLHAWKHEKMTRRVTVSSWDYCVHQQLLHMYSYQIYETSKQDGIYIGNVYHRYSVYLWRSTFIPSAIIFHVLPSHHLATLTSTFRAFFSLTIVDSWLCGVRVAGVEMIRWKSLMIFWAKSLRWMMKSTTSSYFQSRSISTKYFQILMQSQVCTWSGMNCVRIQKSLFFRLCTMWKWTFVFERLLAPSQIINVYLQWCVSVCIYLV